MNTDDVLELIFYVFNYGLTLLVLIMCIKETKSVYFKRAKGLLKMGSYLNILCLVVVFFSQMEMIVFIILYGEHIQTAMLIMINFVVQSLKHIQTCVYCVGTPLRLHYIFTKSTYNIRHIETLTLIILQIFTQFSRLIIEISVWFYQDIYIQFHLDYVSWALFVLTVILESYSWIRFNKKLKVLIRNALKPNECIFNITQTVTKTVIISMFNLLLYVIGVGLSMYFWRKAWLTINLTYFFGCWFVIIFPILYNLVFINVDKIQFDQCFCCLICKILQKCFINSLISDNQLNTNKPTIQNELRISINDTKTKSNDSNETINTTMLHQNIIFTSYNTRQTFDN